VTQSKDDPLSKQLQEIEGMQGCKFENLREAAQESIDVSERLRIDLKKELSELDLTDLDVVITGSIARKEVTRGSDCLGTGNSQDNYSQDYRTLLVNQ
jgi:hypothetical protein